MQPNDVVGATGWLKLRVGAGKCAEAETETGGLDEVLPWDFIDHDVEAHDH